MCVWIYAMNKMTRNHRRKNHDSQDPRKLLKLPVIERLKMRIVQKADISFRKIYTWNTNTSYE